MPLNEQHLTKIVGIIPNVERALHNAIAQHKAKLDANSVLQIAELDAALSGLLADHLKDVQTEIPGSAASSAGGYLQPGSFHQPGQAGSGSLSGSGV